MIIAAAFLALAALPVDSAGVPIDSEPTTAVVSYADLDLATASGRAELDKRLARAVRQVCDEPRQPSTAQHRRIARCVAAARDQAQDQMAEALRSGDKSREVAQGEIGSPRGR